MAYNGPATVFRTNLAIRWFANRASANNGVIPPYVNGELLLAFGGNNMAYEGRQCGKVVSRLDFVCYKLDLPPVGLIADEHFKAAWDSNGSGFEFPVDQMRSSAKSHVWTDANFKAMEELSDVLGAGPTQLWQDELAKNNSMVHQWAFSFVSQPPNKPKKSVNPAWSREELILALHMYIKFRPKLPSKHGTEVAQLSRALNDLASLADKGGTFRNANGVYMKLMNFLSVDPDYVSLGKKGLQRNNKDELFVWNLYADDLALLESTALQILAYVNSHEKLQPLEEGDGYLEAEEGALLTRVHKTRERDAKLIREFKRRIKHKTGSLICAGCGFESADKYGPDYVDTMDAHHIIPVHTLNPGDTTKIDDLVILCANCHRIVHARKKWLTVDALRLIVATRSKT